MDVPNRPFAADAKVATYLLNGMIAEQNLAKLNLSKLNELNLKLKYHYYLANTDHGFRSFAEPTTFYLKSSQPVDTPWGPKHQTIASFQMSQLLNCCGAVIVSRVQATSKHYKVVDDLICQITRLGRYTGMIASAVPGTFQDFLEDTGWERTTEFRNHRYGVSANIIGIYFKESGYTGDD